MILSWISIGIVSTIPRELRDAVGIFLCATLRCAAGFISREIETPSDDNKLFLPPEEEGVSATY